MTKTKQAKTNQLELKVEKRATLGRKVKQLRKKGFLPANIYGRGVKSLAVQGEINSIKKVFDQVGETGLVNLFVKGEKDSRPILFQNPQYDPVSDNLLHLDFYQVDLTQKVTTNVPLEISGESPAVERKEGLLVQVMDEVEVEALPANLPEKFTIDISGLEKVNDAITIGDIKAEKEVEIKAAPDQVVAKIEPPTKEPEPVEQVPTEGEEEEAPTEGQEGEVPAEGETPKEEAAKDTPQTKGQPQGKQAEKPADKPPADKK